VEMHQVRYFLAICEEKSFTRAAKRSGVAQPSLTRAIKRLEAELGGALFDRARPEVRLTEFGELVRSHFAQIGRSTAAIQCQAGKFLARQSDIPTLPQGRRSCTRSTSLSPLQ
jgi:LysR family transcriptional regulator, hydrogen peroxide-inducible genes activator